MSRTSGSRERQQKTGEGIDPARSERFARLRDAAAENTARSQLTTEEAAALVDEMRQEVASRQADKE